LRTSVRCFSRGHSVVILFYVQRERNAQAPGKGSIAIDVQKSFN
jgi:hypothetical protein